MVEEKFNIETKKKTETEELCIYFVVIVLEMG